MKPNRLFVAAALAAAWLVGSAGATAQTGASIAPPATAATPRFDAPSDIARGRSIFIGTCGAYCHKINGANGDAPNLFDCDWLHGGSDDEVFHTISHGVSGTRMVAFGGAIPDEDIRRIVAYLKSASQCKK